MSMLRIVAGMACGALMIAAAGIVSGQAYPNRPLRVVTITAGSGTDFIARIVAQGIAGPLGQPVVVENRGSVLGADIVSKAQPDGYTVLIDSASVWFAPLLQSVPYDPIRDFSPVSKLVSSPLILVTSPVLGINSVAELIALAKTKPGAVNYATGSTGGSGHLTGELFKSLAGINIVRVAYKGSVLALPDLMSGQVHMGFDNPSSMLPHIKTGKLKALAVTSLQPSALLPGLPAVADTVPGYEYISTSATMLAPARTPVAIINRLNQVAVQFLKTSEAQEKFAATGQEGRGSTPEELGGFIKSEMAKWGKLMKDVGIKAN